VVRPEDRAVVLVATGRRGAPIVVVTGEVPGLTVESSRHVESGTTTVVIRLTHVALVEERR
jgi:hypothetical protein